MSSRKPRGDAYEVGYARPPAEFRFRPGQSGNPRGKQRAVLTVRDRIRKVLEQKVSVIENGIKRSITRQDAMFLALANKAARGDLRAADFLLRVQNAYADSTATSIEPDRLGDADQAIIAAFLHDSQQNGPDLQAEPGEDLIRSEGQSDG